VSGQAGRGGCDATPAAFISCYPAGALPQRAGPGYAPIPPGSKRPGPSAPGCATMISIITLTVLLVVFAAEVGWLLADPARGK